MSHKRRTFSSEFKTDLVLKLLQGEKTVSELADEYSIQRDLIYQWRMLFLSKASMVFDDYREGKMKEKLEAERKESALIKQENAKLQRQVGQLTSQVDWLKKKSEEFLGPDYEDRYSPRPLED